jgi:hypothetical protein
MKLAISGYTEVAPTPEVLSGADYTTMKDAIKAELKADVDANSVIEDLDGIKASMQTDYLVQQLYASGKNATGNDFSAAFDEAIADLVVLGYQHADNFVPVVEE